MTGSMLYAWFRNGLKWAALLAACSAAALGQVNPHTGIKWPAGCSGSGIMVYNWLTNRCVAIGTAANPAGANGQIQFNLGGAFSAVPGLTYNVTTNTLGTPSLSIGSTFQVTSAANFVSAVAAAPAGSTLDMSAVSSPITLTSTLTVSNPLKITGCKVQINCSTGQNKCVNIATDDFSFEGASKSCVITQPTHADQAIAFYLGARKRITLKGFKLDWNEDNQDAGPYYTAIASNTSSFNTYPGCNLSDVRIEDLEVTRAGHRGIDFRGSCRVWLINNYFHQTGINVAGTDAGNSVSIDLGGDIAHPTSLSDMAISQDTWCIGNKIDEQGDTFKCGNVRSHVIGNTVRGPADFGHQPWWTSGGIDGANMWDGEFIGNTVRNTFTDALSIGQTCIGGTGTSCSSGTIISPTNMRVIGNQFFCDSKAVAYGWRGSYAGPGASCHTTFGITYYTAAFASGYTVTGNTYQGVTAMIGNLNKFSLASNTFDGWWGGETTGGPYTSWPVFVDGNIAAFYVGGNTIVNSSSNPQATLPAAIYVSTAVSAPTPCTIASNPIDSATFTNTVQWGSAAPLCSLDNSGIISLNGIQALATAAGQVIVIGGAPGVQTQGNLTVPHPFHLISDYFDGSAQTVVNMTVKAGGSGYLFSALSGATYYPFLNMTGTSSGGQIFPTVAAWSVLGLPSLPFQNIAFGNAANRSMTLKCTACTANRTWEFPDSNGVGLPVMSWSTMSNSANFAGANTFNSITPASAITVIGIDWSLNSQANSTPACTAFPSIVLSDGTNTVSCALTAAKSNKCTGLSQNYAAGTTITLASSGGTCTTAPNVMNISVQYKMQ